MLHFIKKIHQKIIHIQTVELLDDILSDALEKSEQVPEDADWKVCMKQIHDEAGEQAWEVYKKALRNGADTEFVENRFYQFCLDNNKTFKPFYEEDT